MTEATAGESATSPDKLASPAELAEQIDASLKNLLVLVGRSMQAKRRLVANVQALQMKAATTNLQTKEELIMLQQYQRGQQNRIPGIKLLEAECVRYDSLVKELSRWITSAKDVLMQELQVARNREDLERIEAERKLQEAEIERLKVEERRIAEEAQRIAAQGQKKESDAIVVDDDEEDDVPLAKRDDVKEAVKSTDAKGETIDLSNDSSQSSAKKGIAEDSSSMNPPMSDPTTLIAALTASNSTDQSNKDGSSMALDNFDFSQLGLQNMDTSGSAFGSLDQGNNFGTDALDFSMDFLDYSTMDNNDASAGGMVDFSNIDFGALLGNNPEAKKE